MVIAPIALMIAASHVLNKLSTDSEIIVMNAAGMPPWRLFRGFLTVTVLVSALVAVVSAYLAPKSLRELRRMAAEIRADVVTNIVQPGRFTSIERGLTFHIRERRADGLLLGIFVDDRRNPQGAGDVPGRKRRHPGERARHVPDPAKPAACSGTWSTSAIRPW